MTLSLLYKIAETINSNSNIYRANVPMHASEYMLHENNALVRTKCRTLHVSMVDTPSDSKAHEWNIYEIDMDNTIRKMSRRNQSFAERLRNLSPSLLDVELIIRRASFKLLKLSIAKTSFDLYINDESDITK